MEREEKVIFERNLLPVLNSSCSQEAWIKPELKLLNINDATLGAGAPGFDCNAYTSGCTSTS